MMAAHWTDSFFMKAVIAGAHISDALVVQLAGAGTVLLQRRTGHFDDGSGDEGFVVRSTAAWPMSPRPRLVADVLFAGSIGLTDFPQGNHQDQIDSITGRLWPMGAQTVFIPGHGP